MKWNFWGMNGEGGELAGDGFEVLKRVAQLVDSGTIKVRIDKVFPLDKAKEAFEHVEKGRSHGKVVLEIKPGN